MSLNLFRRHHRSRLYVLNDGFRSLHNGKMTYCVGQNHALWKTPELRVHCNAVAAFSVQLFAASKHDVLRENGVARQSVTLNACNTTVDGYDDDGDHT